MSLMQTIAGQHAPSATLPLQAPAAEPEYEFLHSFRVVEIQPVAEGGQHLQRGVTVPGVSGHQVEFRGKRYEYRDFHTTRFRRGDLEATILEAYRVADEPAHRDHVLQQPADGGVVVGFIHTLVHGKQPIYRIERTQDQSSGRAEG